MVASIRAALEDEAAGVRQGRKSSYTPERLERMMDVVQADAANVAKAKARYARAAPSDADVAQAARMGSSQSTAFVAACVR